VRDSASASPDRSKAVLFCRLLFFGLGALAFYWSMTERPIYQALASVIFLYLALWGLAFLSSEASKSEKACRFLLTTASIALTVGCLELLVVARVVDFRLTLNTPQDELWRNPTSLFDPTLLHIPKPHALSVWDGIEYRHDQHGFRNESDLERADIVVVGDSIIEGPRVAATDLVTAHLARLLHRVVANLGVSWYGPQQEVELIRRFGLQLHPHTCVWTFYEGNDLWDARRYEEATKDWETFSKDFHSFRQRSFTKNAVLAAERLLDSLHHGSRDQAWENVSGLFRQADGKVIRMYFIEPGAPLSRADMEALKSLRTSFRRAYELCGTVGARFLVVFAPTKFRVYQSFTEFSVHARPRDWVLNHLPKEVQAIVHEELPEAEYLDLTAVFVEQARKGALVYFPGLDTHWSPEGHRVAATAIAEVLTRSPDLPRISSPEGG
jgi:hypothetical protein